MTKYMKYIDEVIIPVTQGKRATSRVLIKRAYTTSFLVVIGKWTKERLSYQTNE
jgi:hypothetical protein